MGIAEIYRDPIFLLQLFVLKKQNVVIKGSGLHLGIALLHASQRPVNGSYGYGKNLFQKVLSDIPISQREHYTLPAPARYNEVSLHVSQSPSFGDFAWSLGDHAFSLDSLPRRTMSAFFLEYSAPVPFNLSAIGTPDVSPDS